MIKSYSDFVADRYEHSQSAKTMPNGNYKTVEDVRYTLGDGSNKNVTLESLMDDADTNKLQRDYPDVVDVVSLFDIDANRFTSDNVYVIFGDDKDGYQYTEISFDDFNKQY